MLTENSIEMSKIMEVQQQLMTMGLDDQIQDMREPVQAPRGIVRQHEISPGFIVLIEGSGTTSGFPYASLNPFASLSPAKLEQISEPPPQEASFFYKGVLDDEGERLKKVGVYYPIKKCYESGGGERSGIDLFPRAHWKYGGGIFDIGGIPSWTVSTIENMNPGFNGEFEMGNKSGGGGIFEIVGIPSGEVTGVLDPFPDHKGNDHVVYIHGDPDVNTANGFVPRSYKKPQAARFIAKVGAVAGAWGTILGMATYLPQEIQWIAAVAAVIPTLAVIFA